MPPKSRFLVPWKAYITVIAPFALLPLALSSYRVLRCLYVVLLMTVLWATQALHYTVVALIPVPFYPVLGIVGTAEVCFSFLQATSFIFLGGMMLAAAFEHTGLHNRVALWFIMRIGTSPVRLMTAIMLSTALLSMWVSNSAAAAIVYPILASILSQVKGARDGKEPVPPPKLEDDETPPERPDDETVGYYIAVAYGATIGGIGGLLGSPPNFLLKLEYEKVFKDYDKLSFGTWMIFGLPYCLLATGLVLLWLQFFYNGLFRAKTPEQAKGIDTQEAVKNILKQNQESMGPMTFKEWVVLIGTAVTVFIWLLRQPSFFGGWSNAFYLKHAVFDVSATHFLIMVFFVVPVNLDFFNFSKPYDKMTPTVLTWKALQHRVTWDVLLLIGGSLAMMDGARESGLLLSISEQVLTLKDMSPMVLMLLATVVTVVLTTLGSNCAVASIVLPVLAIVAREMKIHPLYLMMPASIASSLAFMLPSSTPPNVMAVNQGGVTTLDLLKVGSVATLICLILLIGMFLGLGVFAYGLSEYPDYST